MELYGIVNGLKGLSKKVIKKAASETIAIGGEVTEFALNITPYGRKILQGREEAAKALGSSFKNYIEPRSEYAEFEKLYSSASINLGMQRMLSNEESSSLLIRFAQKRAPYLKSIEPEVLSKGTLPNRHAQDDVLKFMVENGGVGPKKFLQIISSDETMLSRMPQSFREMAQASLSKNTPTRTLREAESELRTIFPEAQAVVEKCLGTGTIGEAYLVRTPDGARHVAKMIKKGVDEELLLYEEQLLKNYIRNISDNPEHAAKLDGIITNLYKNWRGEVNFKKEFHYNQALGEGAQRYKVASVKALSKNADCIIYEHAEGIQLDKLSQMLKLYKENPQAYFSKYKRQIAENPWLENPQKVLDDLPASLIKAFDEMSLFLKKNGESVLHGDPHMGNIFINASENGLVPTFIDTGNCVVRRKKDVMQDVNLFFNYMTGNGEGIAKSLLERTQLPRDINRGAIASDLGQDINKYIFSKGQNTTDFIGAKRILDTLLNRHGIVLNPAQSTALKAQLQFFSNIESICALNGKKSDMTLMMRDLPMSFISLMKNGEMPLDDVMQVLKNAYNNPQNSTRSLCQFIFRPKASQEAACLAPRHQGDKGDFDMIL